SAASHLTAWRRRLYRNRLQRYPARRRRAFATDAARAKPAIGSAAMRDTTWVWPVSLDALEAAPGSHRLLFENDAVRVLETRIAPGETTEVHTHRWPGIVYVLSFGHFVRRDANAAILVDT